MLCRLWHSGWTASKIRSRHCRWSAFINGREVLEGHATIIALGDGGKEEVVVAFQRVAIVVKIGIDDAARS